MRRVTESWNFVFIETPAQDLPPAASDNYLPFLPAVTQDNDEDLLHDFQDYTSPLAPVAAHRRIRTSCSIFFRLYKLANHLFCLARLRLLGELLRLHWHPHLSILGKWKQLRRRPRLLYMGGRLQLRRYPRLLCLSGQLTRSRHRRRRPLETRKFPRQALARRSLLPTSPARCHLELLRQQVQHLLRRRRPDLPGCHPCCLQPRRVSIRPLRHSRRSLLPLTPRRRES